jgi:glycosyltransferase involved in cell wall biosynthesis
MSLRKPPGEREKSDPHVTVLMSVYNGEKYLREAINSILDQTFRDFEFLIVNDFSEDRTPAILESYDDPRIHIINNEENIGLARSLNNGLNRAEGRYIARMDADDVALPHRLERQVGCLDDHPDVALVVSGAFIIDENGEKKGVYEPTLTSEEYYYSLLFCNCVIHSSVMFRKDVVLKLGGYDESLKRSQDYDLWCKISNTGRIVGISEPLIKWRDSKANISAVYKNEQDEAAYQIFSRNASKLLGSNVEVDKIRSLHDEGFNDRPFKVTGNAILKLEMIQRKLIDGCPSWIKRDDLKAFCDQEMRRHLRQMAMNHQLIDLVSLLRDSRIRKLLLRELFVTRAISI